jgi:cysteinyl-tRNA synthetase
MSLTLYNSLTRQKEPFESLEAGRVKIYCCGVTVYDFCHLGHARSYIVWDTVRRYLMWRGYHVTYVQNFTDIDDKIIRRSQADNIPWEQITKTYTQAYLDDMRRLNIQDADRYPRATQVIPQIVQFIERLIDKDYAYPANGDVYYAVERFPSYGKLSGRKLDQMEAGASGRVSEGETKKRHPLDFALWKSAKPGEPAWDSPWGKGRPGWHIECSVMVKEELGDSIDIHMGGQDLTFPHHENEIAQSEAALAAPLSRYWMHNGFVNISGEKMSKSLDNFTTIRQMLDAGIEPMVLRLFVLQAQYRKPIDFTDEAIASAQNAWKTLKDGLLFGHRHGKTLGWVDAGEADFGDPAAMRIESDSLAVQQFQTAMDDDFNTSTALAVLFDLAKDLQKESNRLVHGGETKLDPSVLRQHWQTLTVLAEVLGLEPPRVSIATGEWSITSSAKTGLSGERIQTLVDERLAAKKAKNFAEADRIRDELKAQGIILIDKPGGVTEWRRE